MWTEMCLSDLEPGREDKFFVAKYCEKTMSSICRGGNAPWKWQPIFCHHLVLFLFSSEESLGSVRVTDAL